MDHITKSLTQFDENQVLYSDILGRLRKSGINWALTGGLALSFYGYSRFTKDVDILVDREHLEDLKKLPEFQLTSQTDDFAFFEHLPSGVHVDVLIGGSVFPSFDELTVVRDSEGTPIVSIEDLILLKMKRGDPSDQGDIYRILKGRDLSGIDLEKVREKLPAQLWSKVEDILQWVTEPIEKKKKWSFRSWLQKLFPSD